MDEFNRSTTPEVLRPTPPRWRGAQSLELVYRLNARCIGALCEFATRDEAEATLGMVAANRELWARLSAEAQRAVANLPFLMIDAHFRDETWWGNAVDGKPLLAACDDSPNKMPRELAEQLMHETLMFAWQIARWDRPVAQLSLGMTPGVFVIVAAMTPWQIRTIASAQSQAIQVRWCEDVQFWQDLLVAAIASDTRRLSELHLHAKLRLCGEVAKLQSDPPVTRPNRTVQRQRTNR